MDANKLAALRAAAMRDDIPLDRAAVRELIEEHEAQQRAEGFWSERAPKMNDELLVLRKLEPIARAHVAQEPEHERADALGDVLAELDALRAAQAGAV